jgi:hypothetical protein
MRRFRLAALSAAVLGLVVFVRSGDQPRATVVVHEFELPRLSLSAFGYEQAELDTAVPRGLIAQDRPGFGSGLVALSGNRFIGITDRGPNVDHFPVDASCTPLPGVNGKTFPLPQFTPALVFFEGIGGALRLSSVVNLVDPSGARVTGLTNEAGDETPFDSRCRNTPLPYNPNGMDVEDLALLPSGKFLGVEENKPSIFIGDLTTGVVERRYTPAGRTLPGAGYGVSDRLPGILRNRRTNGGFEAVAVSPDGKVAYTATQNPLGSAAGGSPYRNSRVLRILRLDVSDPYDLRITGQFIWLMSHVSEYPASIGQRHLKLSAMAWVSPDVLLLLERSDEPARGGVRLILVDLRGATDVHGWPVADTLTPENAATDLAALGITPVSTYVIFHELETDEFRIFSTYKLEGMAILNRRDVAIINDNDFGILAPDSPTRLWVIRLAGSSTRVPPAGSPTSRPAGSP